MAIIKYKPTSNGRRNMSGSDFAEITKKAPEKALLESQSHTAGRNAHGHITVRHRGGGHKQFYRVIDFKRMKDDATAKVTAIEYDPNRTANIALLTYEDGVKTYILAPKGLKVGDKVVSGPDSDIKPGKGGQLARSAGASAQLLGHDGKYVTVRLSSGEVRMVLAVNRATIGEVGNAEHALINIGKAGRKRWLGFRPTVRGSVMNPNDHPHGGGEGKAPIGRPSPLSPWGKKTLGKKTRDTKAKSEKFIVRHRKHK